MMHDETTNLACDDPAHSGLAKAYLLKIVMHALQATQIYGMFCEDIDKVKECFPRTFCYYEQAVLFTRGFAVSMAVYQSPT